MYHIHEAIIKNRLDSFKNLLEIHQANINTKEYKYSYRTPLHLAVLNKRNVDFVNLLLKFGADVNAKDGERDRTPLHYASNVQGNGEIVKILIKNGAHVNARDSYGYTPLFFPVFVANQFEIVKILVENNASVYTRSDDELTPLWMATKLRNNIETVKFLLQNGADVDVVDVNGWPLLHEIIMRGHIEVLRLLYDWGVSETADYSTALHIAVGTPRNDDVLRFLLEKGANMNVSEENKTPLEIAIENGEVTYVQIILEFFIQLDPFPDKNLWNVYNCRDLKVIQNEDIKKSLQLLLKHLIKLKMLDLLDEEINLYTLVSRSDFPINFEAACEEEIVNLSQELLPNQTKTYLDLLRTPLQKWEYESIENQIKTVEFGKKYPIYGDFFKVMIRKGV